MYPHAGEEGKFGNEDKESSLNAIKLALKELPDIEIEDPVSADAVFIKAFYENWNAVIMPNQDAVESPAAIYSALEAQGRLLDNVVVAGVNVTEGLIDGFVSTSVDHGTGEASVPTRDDHHGRMSLAPTSSTPASVWVPLESTSPNRVNSMLLAPTGTVASVIANRVQVSD